MTAPRWFKWLILGGLAATITTTSHASRPAPLTIDIYQDTNGSVRFRFFETPALSEGRRVPAADNFLTVYRNGDVELRHGLMVARPMWHVVSEKPAGVVHEVMYGVIPTGFRQHIPAEGEPPALLVGIEYCAEAHSLRACFVYRGRKVSSEKLNDDASIATASNFRMQATAVIRASAHDLRRRA
jgi:hypothetical protein